ncbi:MAG: signal peptidase I [Planctomycetes bacterium]|nr:signal peptidase I [Planctomycetota bacterium]
MNDVDTNTTEPPLTQSATSAADVPHAAAGVSSTERVIDTAQTVLTALILAFVFRAFMVEAFIIPTGSMASALLGAHVTQLCPVCGWEFDYGPDRAAGGDDDEFVLPRYLMCPNCHARWRPQGAVVKPGDRILVHKWLYALRGLLPPRRWDVIVFRDPANPTQNYIKRLVGLPGERIEIVHGDVFINDRIAPKTPAAQNVLWSVVFDQTHMPYGSEGGAGQPRWVPDEDVGEPGIGWTGLDTRVVRYRGLADRKRGISFNPAGSDVYSQDMYAYNHGPSGMYVGDVRVVGELTFLGGDGPCVLEIVRGRRSFAATLDRAGQVSLTQRRGVGADEESLGVAAFSAPRAGRPVSFEFGHVDYRVYLKVNGREVLATTPEQYRADLVRLRAAPRLPPVRLGITARSVELELRGLRIDRDVHYTYRRDHTQRAYAGSAFVLGDEEYFVLGDNSPHSHDSREWTDYGPHLGSDVTGVNYHVGTVPARQIVGRAAMVYLPGLLPLDSSGRWRIPDLGRVRFIR